MSVPVHHDQHDCVYHSHIYSPVAMNDIDKSKVSKDHVHNALSICQINEMNGRLVRRASRHISGNQPLTRLVATCDSITQLLAQRSTSATSILR